MKHDATYNNSQCLEDMVRLLRVSIFKKDSYNSNVVSVSREIKLRLEAL